MREYMELIDFLKEVGDGILDHLPEKERVNILTAEEIIKQWMQRKTYLQALSLRKDIVSYTKLHERADYSVDEVFADFDVCFIPERFGVDEPTFLTGILGSIDAHIKEKEKALLVKYFGWLGYK